MGHIDKRTRFKVLERGGFKCHYCGRTPPEVTLEVDHQVPLSMGGSNSNSNLVPACFDCNRGKSADLIDAPWISDIRQRLVEGRGIVEIEMYCDNQGCPSREVTLHIKDHDSDFVVIMKTRGKMRCPVCAKALKYHHTKTMWQVNESSEAGARRSVNVQRYRRDHPGRPIPLSVAVETL